MKLTNILFTIVVLFVWNPDAECTVRFVRPGNPTPVPPYTSWATASDSVQKCINISQPYDTVYLAAGVYKERVVLKEHMSLIGMGIDSSIFDFRAHEDSLEYIVRAVNGGFICGITFLMPVLEIGYPKCIRMYSETSSSLGHIESVKIIGGDIGVFAFSYGCRVTNSIFIDVSSTLVNHRFDLGRYYFNNNLVYKFPGVSILIDGLYFEA